jgi:acyl CoA:acetate/3-ketoacid CoA transferase beta subunit
MTDYTTSELLAVNIARQIDDGDVVILGSFTPLAYTAYLLAKLTHAPSMTYIAYSAIDALPFRISFTTSEPAALSTGASLVGLTEVINWIHQTGSADVEAVSGAQIDGRGDINLSVIGPYDQPKVRLPGGAGAGEVLKMHRKMIAYVPLHNPRILVPKVDFVTGTRWKRTDEERRAAHLRPGPMKIVTNLSILVWDGDADGFVVEALAPGVEYSQVRDATGFPLPEPASPATMAEPSAEEVRLIREVIDPFGTREFDLKAGRERLAYLREMFEKEYALAAEELEP